jgi:alkylation response protein AidB-like acyl-CoA dehydrogenase
MSIMMGTTETKSNLKGGEFLLKESLKGATYIPEDFDEEQLMIQEMVRTFKTNEVWPVAERLEELEEGLTVQLMEKLGELGLFGTHMPEQYGGMDLDFNTNTIVAEEIGPTGGFSVSYNAHTGIGMLPILYFGSEAQKEKYLPKLISGEWKAAYCLTEPSSGSDALAAKSKAELSDDGKHFVMNGQKMWISNAGFADVFTVFAKVVGENLPNGKGGFTGFILEKGMPGFTLGAEEKKLGIKSSSTRQIFMENVKVPVENVLGAVGRGHIIAFNALNIGRFKLGASCLGGIKQVINESVRYANERKQFKVPISSFGAIQHKLAEQTIKSLLTESGIYRVSEQINQKVAELKQEGKAYAESKLLAAEEYALECSIIKIVASEVLDYCVDEAVQVHGGMGYSEEGKVARAYRDSRINRIFEGTNEINRMIMVNTLMKRAMKGKLDIATPALAVQAELTSGKNGKTLDPSNPYAKERYAVSNFKKVLLMVLGSAAKLAMGGKLDLKHEQELLMNLSDIMIDIFNVESLLLRTEKLHNKSVTENLDIFEAALKTATYDANFRVMKNAMDALAVFVKPEKMDGFLDGVKKFTNYPIQNVKEHRRKIASSLIEANEYYL